MRIYQNHSSHKCVIDSTLQESENAKDEGRVVAQSHHVSLKNDLMYITYKVLSSMIPTLAFHSASEHEYYIVKLDFPLGYRKHHHDYKAEGSCIIQRSVTHISQHIP